MRWNALITVIVSLAIWPMTASGEVYTNTTQRFRLKVPAGWTTADHPKQEQFAFALDIIPPDPDDSAAVVVAATDAIPEMGPPRLLAHRDIMAAAEQAKASHYFERDDTRPGARVRPTVLRLKVLSEGAVKGRNASGYQATYMVAPVEEMARLGSPVLLRRTAYFISGHRVYIIACSAETKADFDRHTQTFSGLIGSFEIIGGQQPPPFEIVKSEQYRNPKLGFELRVPKGWILYRPEIPKPKENQRSKVTVLDRVYCATPDAGATMSCNVVRAPGGASARDAVREDNKLDEKASDGNPYLLVKEGPCDVGGLKGWQSVTRLTVRGVRLWRWRAYLESGDLLFPFVCDVTPPEAFQTQAPMLVGIVRSFKLKK